MTTELHNETRLKTPLAASRLGCSPDTLRGWAKGRKSADGSFVEPILSEGEHWFRRSAAPNAPIIFRLEQCQKVLSDLGYELPA